MYRGAYFQNFMVCCIVCMMIVLLTIIRKVTGGGRRGKHDFPGGVLRFINDGDVLSPFLGLKFAI